MEWLRLNSESIHPRAHRERARRGSRIRHYTYEGAVLDCASGGIILNDRYMPPSRGPRYNLSAAQIRSIVDDATQASTAQANVAVGYRAGWKNYYHWTTQCLLSIHSLSLEGVLDNGLLAVPELGGIQLRSLDLLGIDRGKLLGVRSTGAIQAKRFTATNAMFTSTAQHFPLELKKMADVLKAGASLDRPGSPPAVYISRLDSHRRKMRNEEALITALEKLGVQAVSMTGKTLDEQISIISNVRLIVAPHGAGLTNILYAAPGAHLYELFSASYTVNCYQALAQAVGIGYTNSVFQPTSGDGHSTVWSADVDEVTRNTEARLEQAATSV